MALGIDGAAHEGALEADAGTIAVVGTGLDRVYPARHRNLAHRIAERGLIVGEFALGTPALPPHFPVRNRIIAGLARGTLVVEAALQSGSLITARLALECGRDVFAIPGSIHAPQSRGCHLLIKQGAKLVDAASDVLEEFGIAAPPVAASRRSPARQTPPTDALVDALGFEPIALDALIARTGLSAADLSARLLDLELTGRVVRLPGQRFQRIGSNGPEDRSSATATGAVVGLGYSESMFDVLVYLYENYWRPDACPEHDQLTRKLTSVGFEHEEIEDALTWLDGVAAVAEAKVGDQREQSLRVYAPAEQDHLGEQSIGFITFLESAGVLAAAHAGDGDRPGQRDFGRADRSGRLEDHRADGLLELGRRAGCADPRRAVRRRRGPDRPLARNRTRCVRFL